MKTIVLPILLGLLVWMNPTRSYAQMDPVLTGMIIDYTNKAKSQYNSQLKTMATETEGHVWLKQEVESTANYQKQFDNYLNSFRSIISYAAQTYGFYYEINHLCENMNKLSAQIGNTPTNAVAVALHNKQRVELVFSIRPQLKDMNYQLATLTKLVRCTNMGLVWHNIEYGSLPHRTGKAGIIEDCLSVWRVNAKSVKPKK